MKYLLITFFLLLRIGDGTKDYTSVTGLYQIQIPDTWFVEVTGKWGEQYLKKGEYKGDFDIDIRSFLKEADAKASYYELLPTFKNATLTRLNEVEVIICSGIFEEEQEYNWVFYFGKYEIWCQYKFDPKTLDEAELAEVTKSMESMTFFNIE
ncbi:MAG: hypothetical protein COB85_06220 [Bacteroidetes bacterium]|nr:MAG: hypothetical protein COB85_06220 [Bacteroidota bacterium]